MNVCAEVKHILLGILEEEKNMCMDRKADVRGDDCHTRTPQCGGVLT